MTEKKSEAQLKNEEEVRRILNERGYTSASSKKQISKYFGRNISFAPILIIIVAMGLAIGGWFLYQNIISGTKQDKSISLDDDVDSESELNQDYLDFKTCLSAIDQSEISVDDANFWNKHIYRYEQAISCYDNYPSVANSAEKNELQNKLSVIKECSESINANDETYKTNITKINTELEQNLAKIKEESDAWDKELLERTQERQDKRDELYADYTKQQEERERQTAEAEAQRQQQERAAKEKCNNYLATYGNSTPEELANNDQAVKAKYNTWQDWLMQAKEVEGVQFTYQQCQIIWSKGRTCPNQYAGKAQEAESEYNQLLNQKIEYYKNLKANSCGGQ